MTKCVTFSRAARIPSWEIGQTVHIASCVSINLNVSLFLAQLYVEYFWIQNGCSDLKNVGRFCCAFYKWWRSIVGGCLGQVKLIILNSKLPASRGKKNQQNYKTLTSSDCVILVHNNMDQPNTCIPGNPLAYCDN